MSRHISNVVDIKPNQRKWWTSLVQVLENGHTQTSLSGSEFKRLVLADSEGTKFTALICGSSNIRYFAKLLAQYKRYYISNAVIIDNEAKYRISSYPYSWLLNNKTLVEECVDSIPVPLGCQFEFTNFSDLNKYADTDSLHSIKAIVLKCFPPKEQGSEFATKRDIVIVNEEKKLLLLTLWSPFDENEGAILADMIDTSPMIIAMRLRVTTFNTLSLTTRSTSGFMINPPVTPDLQLQEWYNNNKVELQQMLQMETYRKNELLLPFPKEEDIISIATAVASLKTKKTCWIKGKISLPKQERSMWYTACANCQKSLEADVTWVVTCPSCTQESEVQARSRLTIQLDDGTTSIHAILYTPHVEELIPFTSLQLKAGDEAGKDLYDDIAMSIKKHTVVAFIRTFETSLSRQTAMKMTVVHAYKVEPRVLPSTDVMSLPAPCDTSTSKGKDQLFTPTTKKVLEEIGTTISSKPVKRSLSFAKEDIKTEKNSSINKTGHTLAVIKKEVGAQVQDGSPTKKTKESGM